MCRRRHARAHTHNTHPPTRTHTLTDTQAQARAHTHRHTHTHTHARTQAGTHLLLAAIMRCFQGGGAMANISEPRPAAEDEATRDIRGEGRPSPAGRLPHLACARWVVVGGWASFRSFRGAGGQWVRGGMGWVGSEGTRRCVHVCVGGVERTLLSDACCVLAHTRPPPHTHHVKTQKLHTLSCRCETGLRLTSQLPLRLLLFEAPAALWWDDCKTQSAWGGGATGVCVGGRGPLRHGVGGGWMPAPTTGTVGSRCEQH